MGASPLKFETSMSEISTSIEVQLAWVHLFLNAISQLILFEMDAPSDDHLSRPFATTSRKRTGR